MSKSTTPRRPIDRTNINRDKTAVGTTQSTLVVRTAGEAETLVRTMVSLGVVKGAATGAISGALLLVVNRDGQTLSTALLTSNGPLYKPEQDIIWHETFKLPAGAEAVAWLHFKEDSQAMRKLKKGDTLTLIELSSAADGFDVFGNFTTWAKQ